jgi:hypothetical protein
VPLIAFTCLRSDTLSCHSHLQLCWQSKPFLSSSSSLSNRLTEDWMEGKWSSFAQSFWKLCWSSQSVECPQNYRPQAVDKAKAGLSTASTTTAVAGCRPAPSGQVCGRRIGRSLGRLTRILVAQTSSQITSTASSLRVRRLVRRARASRLRSRVAAVTVRVCQCHESPSGSVNHDMQVVHLHWQVDRHGHSGAAAGPRPGPLEGRAGPTVHYDMRQFSETMRDIRLRLGQQT